MEPGSEQETRYSAKEFRAIRARLRKALLSYAQRSKLLNLDKS